MALCSGEIDWTSEGYWFCLKCGQCSNEPGNADTEHEAPSIGEQLERARQAFEIHFDRLIAAGMSPEDVRIWAETELALLVTSYVRSEENATDN